MSKVLLNNKWFDTEDKDYQEKLSEEIIKNGCPNKDELLIVSIDHARHKDACWIDPNLYYEGSGKVVEGTNTYNYEVKEKEN